MITSTDDALYFSINLILYIIISVVTFSFLLHLNPHAQVINIIYNKNLYFALHEFSFVFIISALNFRLYINGTLPSISIYLWCFGTAFEICFFIFIFVTSRTSQFTGLKEGIIWPIFSVCIHVPLFFECYHRGWIFFVGFGVLLVVIHISRHIIAFKFVVYVFGRYFSKWIIISLLTETYYSVLLAVFMCYVELNDWFRFLFLALYVIRISIFARHALTLQSDDNKHSIKVNESQMLIHELQGMSKSLILTLAICQESDCISFFIKLLKPLTCCIPPNVVSVACFCPCPVKIIFGSVVVENHAQVTEAVVNNRSS